MKTYNQLISRCKDQRGVTAVVIAVVIIVLMGLVALAVDVGYLAATKGELQNIADSGALAGAGLLGNIYTGMDAPVQGTWDCSAQKDLGVGNNDCDAIKDRVRQVVGTSAKNRAAGKTDMDISDGDIIIYNLKAAALLGGTKYAGPDITLAPTAVRVIARRDDTAGGNSPIGTFFARIFGFENVNVSADATAALSGVAQTGEVNFPMGLSWTNFVEDCSADPIVPRGDDVCANEITLNPTSESCAGWHNFTGDANTSDMAAKAFDLIAQDTGCDEALCGQAWIDTHWPSGPEGDLVVDPPTVTGDTEFNFTGGTVGSMFLGSYLEWYDDPSTTDVVENTEPVGVDPAQPVAYPGNPQAVLGTPTNKPAPFIALFDYFRFRDNDYIDENGNGVFDEGEGFNDDSVWTALAPVYEDECPCDNPNQSRTIIGFVTVRVSAPNPPPDSKITAKVDCNFQVVAGRGGGGGYSFVMGAVPGLVE